MSKVKGTALRILSLLPGVDCGGFGGCGYPTCEACAQAIAEGKSAALCPACDSDAVRSISEELGREPVEACDQVAFLKCAGDAAGKKRFQGMESCQKAKECGFLDGECQWGCMGIGSCIERCKFDAMHLEDGQLVIDRDKCTGCMACIDICPQHIIEMIPREATNFIPCSSKDNEQDTLQACGYGCIGCGDCALACPNDAIEMVVGDKIDGRYAKIDYSKCEGCVTCTVKCRKKIIVDTLHDLTKLKEDVAFVKCAGGAWGHKKLEDLGYTSCSDIVKDAADGKIDLDEIGVCTYSCTGMGDCVKACRYGAISNEYGVAKVDDSKCVGCGDCFRACPGGKIQMVPYLGVKQAACESEAEPDKRMEVCGMGCIGCGDCADNCPSNAITMTDGHPVIDHKKCQNCGICTYVCSRGLIQERVVPEYIYLQQEAMKLDMEERG